MNGGHAVASQRKVFTRSTFAKWIKEGRGNGEYADYKPWLTVRDLPSLGRVHRVFGHKSRRTHHLLSDLELAAFLLLEWHPEVTQIREQFPLIYEDTKQVSEKIGVSHPSDGGHDQYMSSDFLIDSLNKQERKFVWQAKYASGLTDKRTIEKLEIERRYWLGKEYSWYLITEKQIPSVVFNNIKWLYPAERYEEEPELEQQKIEFYAHHFAKQPHKTVISICKELDAAYDLPLGESLYEVRTLLAKRYFTFDIFIPTIKLKAGNLRHGSFSTIREVYSVSNQ